MRLRVVVSGALLRGGLTFVSSSLFDTRGPHPKSVPFVGARIPLFYIFGR